MSILKIYIDTETTGVDRNVHHAHQIAGIIVDGDEVVEKFNIVFRPHSLDGAEPEALVKTHLTLEELDARPKSVKEAHVELCSILARHINKYDKTDKAFLVGYNAQFDADFLRKFFTTAGDNYFGSWFWTPAVDVMSVAAWFIGNNRKNLPNFKLGTVCVAADIEWSEDHAHDAFYDVAKTFELDSFLRNNIAP
jgi:DNA polymerase-3 subunit epsilon